MSNVVKQSYTAPIPKGAEIFTRKGIGYAKYKGRDGKVRTDKLTNDGKKLLRETETWYARINLADGGTLKVNTKCKDKTTAMQFATALETEQEKIIAGVFTKKEVAAAQHGRDRIQKFIDSYLESMAARGKAPKTIKEFRRYLEVVCRALGWSVLRDVDKVALDAYLEEGRRNGRGARSCNAHVVAWTAFGNWLANNGKTSVNPVGGLVRFNERIDSRRPRRAFTLSELQVFLEVAAERPLQERLKNRGSKADLKPETIDKLKWLGRTRALAYQTLAYTGLRWSELKSITIGAAYLDEKPAFLILEPKDEKNRQGSKIPLQDDLRESLKTYRAKRLQRLAGGCKPFPGTFDGEAFFDALPKEFIKVFNRDLEAAGIAKKNATGRTLDVHALRATFCTLLNRAGVGLVTTQKLMRHSDARLTANIYTVLELTDTAGAVNALPKIESSGEEEKAGRGE